MRRIRVTGWIDLEEVPSEFVDTTRATGLTEEGQAQMQDWSIGSLEFMSFVLERERMDPEEALAAWKAHRAGLPDDPEARAWAQRLFGENSELQETLERSAESGPSSRPRRARTTRRSRPS